MRADLRRLGVVRGAARWGLTVRRALLVAAGLGGPRAVLAAALRLQAQRYAEGERG